MRVILEVAGPGVDMLPAGRSPWRHLRVFMIPSRGAEEGGGAIVQWLVDSEERLREYLDFARRRGITLRVNLEIDVGLHRGGRESNEELGRMLGIIAAGSGRLVFAGFMGYDGHVAHVPLYIGS